MVKLYIHLIECFLHVLNVHSSHLHQALPVPTNRADGADGLRWTMGSTQKTYRVEILQPLTIAYISFAAWHIFHVTCVHQTDSESAVLQNLKQRDPENACGLHSHALHTASTEPIDKAIQIIRECRKAADRLRIAIRRDRYIYFVRAYVDAGCVGLQHSNCGGHRAPFLNAFGFRHFTSMPAAGGPSVLGK